MGVAALVPPKLPLYRCPLSVAFPILALLAALAVGLLFLLPGGPLQAQDANGPIEYDENGTGPVATYTAVDPEGTAITSWTLDGTDADAFTIVGGVLRFAETPDYEMPADVAGTSPSTAAANDNEYEITIQAMDSTGKTGMQEVMVEVINVDEDGTVTLSARQPLVAVAFTASLIDPDADATNPTPNLRWQWAKSRSKNGSYTDIDDKAEAITYTPTDATGKTDVGYYLRATVSYTDLEGSGKTAMMLSDYPVQATRDSNNPPKSADDQDPTRERVEPDAAREVAENTEAGTDIGAPLVATDEDDDVLTYTLTDDDGGTDGDSASFAIDWATGQLMTKADLDKETKAIYTVVVRATDPDGVPQADPEADTEAEPAVYSDTVTVMITVTDVNEPPAVDGNAAVTFDEDTGDIATPLGTYMEDDPETDDASTWSLSGDDAGKFDISTDGDLTFNAKPDYENPTDANTDNVYEVTVQATDANGNRGTKDVKVTVDNAEEAGVVTLSKTQPRVGVAVTASLTDPDGSISSLTWQWSITGADAGGVADVTATPGGNIEDANSDAYIPCLRDVGGTLTAMASYTDGHDSGKMAEIASANMVALDTRNKPPVFADQDTETDGVQNESTTRKVDENTKALAGSDDDDAADATDAAGDNVGAVVVATDPDPNAETPTYTLGGADAAKFRVRANGQIEVGSGTELDYETKTTYMVTLTAEDSFGSSSSIAVTIMVNPIDEVPEIMLGGLAISGMISVEYAENGMDAVATYTAAGPNADMATWTLAGDDAGDFMISGGMLTFVGAPDYEMPADADTDNTYMVTVKAADGTYSNTHAVTVMVTNEDEPGRVTFWRDEADATTAAIMVGDELGGAVDDSDGNPGDTFPIAMYTRIDNVTSWQWAKSMTPDMMDSWMDIGTGGMYTVIDDDDGYYLRATASYTDGHGSGKSKEAVSAKAVDAEGTGDPLLAKYDKGGDGKIDFEEDAAEVEVLDVVARYFSDRRGAS